MSSLILVALLLAQALPASFYTVRDVPLPGDTSRFDYVSLDPGSHRLFIAHLGMGTVPVYDIGAGAIVGEVQNVPGVHGVLAVPELGRVYASATSTNQVAVIDPQTLSVVATIPGGEYPDGIAYDPELGKLYVSDESGGTDTVIDTASNQVVATIPLGGEDHPHGVQISPDRLMAFVACESNAKLVVMDLQSMSVTETYDVGSAPDVLTFDASRRVLYVAAESGPATAFSETDTGLKPLAQQSVGPNAHSLAVDPDTGHVYFPLANLGGQPVLREASVTTATGDDDE